MTDIMGIFGLQGWGKSALTAYFALLAHNMGYTIYSNFPLSFDYIPITTIKEAQECRNGYLCLDEIWAWVHARTSQSKINKEMMAICLLNRKRNVNIIYNTQLPRTIDVILREVTNYRYLPHLVTHKDGKRYIHYTVKDLLDRETEEMIVPMSIDEIGKLFNTRYEVKKLGEETNNFENRIKGDLTEYNFFNVISKHPDILRAYPEKNSGLNSSIPFDVLGYGINKNIAVDVKGCNRDVYITEHGEELINKINCLKNKKTGKFLYDPYFAFPVKEHKLLNRLYDWYMLSINEYFKYLYKLKCYPSYSSLIKKSVLLSKLNF